MRNVDVVINRNYFIIPFTIGILPGIICGFIFIIANAFSGGFSEALAPVLTAYMIFIMIYAYPPAVIVHPLGIEVYGSSSGSMISYPNTVLSWVIVVGTYVIAGIIINRVLKIRYRRIG
jgi:uncharacterized membrane protein